MAAVFVTAITAAVARHFVVLVMAIMTAVILQQMAGARILRHPGIKGMSSRGERCQKHRYQEDYYRQLSAKR
ncbi:MAG: hypothetical protein FIA91_13020 [Geobacter sp.]|nr:hypothetical protein [Geobacter sp.]